MVTGAVARGRYMGRVCVLSFRTHAAEIDVLERRIVTIPAKDWAKFEAWASGPAKKIPALRKLAKTRPAWQG